MAGVRVTAGSGGVDGWTVTLTLPAGTAVTNGWNGTFNGSGGTVRVTNVSHNGRLAAGQSHRLRIPGLGRGKRRRRLLRPSVSPTYARA